MHWVGQVGCAKDSVVHEGSRGGNHGGSGNDRSGGNNSVVAETVSKTSKEDLSISLSLPLSIVVSMVSMVVVEVRCTGNRDVGAIHTRGALVAQGVAVVGDSVVASVVAVVGFGFPLPAAGHCSSKVVGAETNVAGVDEASRGGGNSVNWVGQSRVAEDGRGNGMGGKNTVVAETSKEHLSISLSFPLLLSEGPGSIGESSVGQGGSSTGHGQVQSVHTRGTLASEGVHSISIGEGESRVNHVGRGDGRKRGKSNKELHDGVR